MTIIAYYWLQRGNTPEQIKGRFVVPVTRAPVLSDEDKMRKNRFKGMSSSFAQK